MDLHRILLKGNQKANMSPYGGSDFFPVPQFSQTSGFHGFNKDYRPFPCQSFSCPNSFTSFNFSPEKLINKAVDLTQGMRRLENLPAMNLTCIVGGFVDGKQGVWNSTAPSAYSNSLKDMVNQIVSKSVEITRTMSCPDPFNLHDFNSAKATSKKENMQKDQQTMDCTPAKMSYADVAKMNLSNLNKNFSCKPSSSTHISSQKSNCSPCGRKGTKVSLSHQPYKPVNKNNFRSNRSGTINNNLVRSDKESGKAKFNHPIKTSNTRRFQVKRPHSSCKRELGTKRNNQKIDFDGSMWGRDNMEVDMCEDSTVVSTPGPCHLVRMRSGSSESDCSSEVSDYLKNPRVRSLSECSVNSIDSEDSFIIFDECPEDSKEDDSYEESSSDESDECSSGYSSSNGVALAQSYDYLQCVNSKWDSNHRGLRRLSNCSPNVPDAKNSSPHSSCAVTNALKKVRFACGEALTKVRKLCVWDYAHRAARVGPWEQAARDRDRFAKRIASLAPILNPILDSEHRKKTYDDRFAPR